MARTAHAEAVEVRQVAMEVVVVATTEAAAEGRPAAGVVPSPPDLVEMVEMEAETAMTTMETIPRHQPTPIPQTRSAVPGRGIGGRPTI